MFGATKVCPDPYATLAVCSKLHSVLAGPSLPVSTILSFKLAAGPSCGEPALRHRTKTANISDAVDQNVRLRGARPE